MALLLQAQSAQLSGDRKQAEDTFTAMLQHPETRTLALRGLHMEALRRQRPRRGAGPCGSGAEDRHAALVDQGHHRGARGRRSVAGGADKAVERAAGARILTRTVSEPPARRAHDRDRARWRPALARRGARTRPQCAGFGADLGARRGSRRTAARQQGRDSAGRQDPRNAPMRPRRIRNSPRSTSTCATATPRPTAWRAPKRWRPRRLTTPSRP